MQDMAQDATSAVNEDEPVSNFESSMARCFLAHELDCAAADVSTPDFF